MSLYVNYEINQLITNRKNPAIHIKERVIQHLHQKTG